MKTKTMKTKPRHKATLAALMTTSLALGGRLVTAGRKTDPRVAEFVQKLPSYLERIERRMTRMDLDD